MPAIVRAEIDLAALKHNVSVMKSYAPKAKILAMIKANAYGHGMQNVAETLAPLVDGLGVARVAEAVMLHRIGIRKPIFILDGFFSQDELQETINDNFIAVLNNHEQVQLLEAANLSHPINVWLKINTGMNRLGVHPNDFPAIYNRLKQHPLISQPIGLMTHFACADEKNNPLNQRQINCFFDTVKNYPGEKSLANSAAIMNFPDVDADWVRPGIMLYGCSPMSDKKGVDLGLWPVMTLKSEIIAINHVACGEQIGYGSTYTCEEETRIGVVAIGYGDGYPRHVKNGTPVLIDGHYAPIAGRVSMDMITVDLKNHPHARVGDEVILWGVGLPVEVIARAAETIGYELLCQVNQLQDRVIYRYLGEK